MRTQPSRKKRQRELASAGELLAGAAVVDITPPLEVGLLMSSVEGRWQPFDAVRLPLKARALVLESGKERIALLSLDLLGLTSAAVGGWRQFKRTLSRATSNAVQPGKIVITCTHTHSAPESVAITGLYRTKPFRVWLEDVRSKLANAIVAAAKSVRPCTIALASGELRGFSLQRRIPTASGIVMSDSVQPISLRLLRRKPVDHRVHSVCVCDAEGSAIATIVHGICHPVHEMCAPQVSSDFPGELCAALEASKEHYGVSLFFNGAAGDINPTTVSGGPACARRHGHALAQTIDRAIRKKLSPVKTDVVAFRSVTVPLPTRSLSGKSSGRNRLAHLSALRLGNLALVFVAGELFVETALEIERSSRFERTLIVGFAESSIGYVPTERAFREGGYEIGPGKWSYLRADAEPILRRAAAKLLREL